MVCSILGRSYCTGVVTTDRTALETHRSSAPAHRDSVIKASFGLCSIIAEITPKLGTDDSISPIAAEGFLKRLHEWSSILPVEMRRFSRSAEDPLTVEEQERMIGNVHVSCAYYFAAMLVTRPFLTTHLMAHLSNGVGSSNLASSSATPEVSDLAQACIDSAILMANMCYEALQSGILLKQMCILK
jgi:hypothetical protein